MSFPVHEGLVTANSNGEPPTPNVGFANAILGASSANLKPVIIEAAAGPSEMHEASTLIAASVRLMHHSLLGALGFHNLTCRFGCQCITNPYAHQ